MDNNELFDMLMQEFSTDEDHKMFIANFKFCLLHDRQKDFIIDLDDVYSYIGFINKATAKRSLESSFIHNTEYISTDSEPINKVLLNFQVEQKEKDNRGGHNKQTILMTPDTFRDLCLQARTEQGKKIRQFYMKMIDITYKYIQSKSTTKIKELEDQLQSKSLLRQRKLYELGDTVYVWDDKSGNYKVGSTDNMNAREKTYFCHQSTGEMCYVKRCNNKTLLEDVVHHMLRKYAADRKDWFTLNVDIIKKVIDVMQIVTDKISLHVDKFNHIDIVAEFEAIFNKLADAAPTTNTDNTITPTNERNIDNSTSNQQYIDVVVKKTKHEQLQMPALPPDFDKFITECFVDDPEAKTSWVEISARYRLWSRSLDQFKVTLMNFMKERGYKESFLYDPDTKMNVTCFNGLRMIPLQPIPLSDNPSSFEQFVNETCVLNVTGRIACKDFKEHYAMWKSQQQGTEAQSLKLTQSEIKEMKVYCEKHFVGATVHNGERCRYGYYGVSFKGMEQVGMKTKKANRKSVYQLDSNTNDIVNTFESLTHAANTLGMTLSKLSTLITNRKLHNGYRFAYTNAT